MKFFIENKEIDETIKDIRKRIRLSMNGDVSDSMVQRGIIYKRNYGVDIPRIKELCKKYEPNRDLAQRLWALEIRETMIMAMMLHPVESFSIKDAEEWMESVIHTELAEQFTMNLLSKVPFGVEFSLKLINAEKMWHQITGFMLIARIWKSFSEKDINEILERAITLTNTDELHLYKSIALALSRLCRQGAKVSELILGKIGAFEQSDLISEKYIYSEIKNEADFMNF